MKFRLAASAALTATLFAFFGTYLMLKSSMGAFANIILKILLILVATIVPMLRQPRARA